ncbi:ATP-binding protein [Actinomadura rudentiformis]|uniref:AAA family ATPase n=1 Tax=Actinomadura rudentiformis TaxID=359158 RepID=A0A6H9YQH4_9ACTN|nr:AAA family ATPase [Actinomadura rudentiformis]KAB2349667.1 AAA family ATPase [Actinomadura rudentiformis]
MTAYNEMMANGRPVGLSELIGRGPEMAELRRMLPKARLLTLTGAGGVGKTRLARRAARTLRGWFPGGVEFVELATLEDGALLESAVASALRLRHSGRQAMPVLVHHLADKRMLLILDNCEHLLEACADLVDRLLHGAPRLRILVTSRQRLGVPGEHVLAVPELPVPPAGATVGDIARSEAVRLFAERAAEVRPGFVVDAANAPAVARLSQRLEGLPLAIELAAARLRTMPLDELVRKLDDRFDVLARRDPSQVGGSAPPHHETLRATMDWSYGLCSPGERLMWARLSIFPGGVDLDTAEAVCAGGGIAPEDVFELLTGLLDKSILSTERSDHEVRFSMLDSIRAYGREQLTYGAERASGGERAPYDEQALYERYRDHYLRLATGNRIDALAPNQLDRIRTVRTELPNLRVALDLCFKRGDPSAGLEIAFALWGHFLLSGAISEGRYWAERGLALGPQTGTTRAKALWAAALFALHQDDLPAATQRADECRTLAERTGDATASAFAVETSGMIALATGDSRRGFELMREARARLQAVGDLPAVGINLYYSASVGVTESPEVSAALGRELLALTEAHEAPLFQAYALLALGFAAWRQGDSGTCEVRMRRAVRTLGIASDRWGLLMCLEALAWTACMNGRHERSARLMGATGRLWQTLDTPPVELQILADSHRDCEAAARRVLGPQAYATTHHAGARLELDRAVAYALEDGGESLG